MIAGIIKIRLWLFVFYLVLISETLHAERLAVVYPEIREPYRQIFLNIFKGIEASYEGRVSAYVLEEDSTSLRNVGDTCRLRKLEVSRIPLRFRRGGGKKINSELSMIIKLTKTMIIKTKTTTHQQ